MLNALLAERCDLSCYLRRRAEYSDRKLRETYADALDRRYLFLRVAVTHRSAVRPDLAHRQEGLDPQAAGAVADFFQAFACRPTEAVIIIALACWPLLMSPRLVRARSR